MLQKYCKKCWNKGHIIIEKSYRWIYDDELRWKQGIIACPEKYIRRGEKITRKLTDNPPNNCPFLIEHLLTKED